MRQAWVELILELFAEDRLSAAACALRVASLDHEVFDEPMELSPVIVARLTQLEEVFARLWHFGAFDLNRKDPLVGSQVDSGLKLARAHDLIEVRLADLIVARCPAGVVGGDLGACGGEAAGRLARAATRVPSLPRLLLVLYVLHGRDLEEILRLRREGACHQGHNGAYSDFVRVCQRCRWLDQGLENFLAREGLVDLSGLFLGFGRLSHLPVMVLLDAPPRVLGVLKGYDLLRIKLIVYMGLALIDYLTAQQVMIELGLFVELLESGVREHVASLPDRDDVRVVSELLVCYGAVILALLVLVKVQLDQVCLGQGRAGDRVLLVLLQVGDDREEVEDERAAVGFHGAVGVLEGRHGQAAVVEGGPHEGVFGLFLLAAPLRHVLLVRDPHLVLRVPLLTHY